MPLLRVSLPEGCPLSPIPPCTHSPRPPGIDPSLVSEPAKLGGAEAKAKDIWELKYSLDHAKAKTVDRQSKDLPDAKRGDLTGLLFLDMCVLVSET